MVTMQQIADRCGVSRGTVDRALHHKEGVREEVSLGGVELVISGLPR